MVQEENVANLNSEIELSELLREYVRDIETLEVFTRQYRIVIPNDVLYSQETWLHIAVFLISNLKVGSFDLLLDDLFHWFERRSDSEVTSTKWQEREHHQTLARLTITLRENLGGRVLPREIHVEDKKPFTAKSEIRELLGKATSEIVIVDPYIGYGTLDCLRDTTSHCRVLTNKNNVKSEFRSYLDSFRSEGESIEVRSATSIHDRIVVFNEKVWLLGSSIKDAGIKQLNAVELYDSAESVRNGLEEKWKMAEFILQ